ncbi:MAG: hypothetical protein HRU32_12990 [Rhodobacteraceae bacterium]|nr:hypothetical protein [Paracoccaceae bacterium]
MSTRAAVFATLIIAQTGSAQAEALLCMGIAPGFLMVVEGDTTTFDYLGDGDFDLDPALPLAISGGFGTRLKTAGGDIPVYIEERACRVVGIDLPIRIELGIDTSAGFTPFAGCCKRAEP